MSVSNKHNYKTFAKSPSASLLLLQRPFPIFSNLAVDE